MRRVLAVLTLTLAASAGAQVPGRPARPTPTRNPADTLRRDAADTTKSKILIKWEDPDSMTTALLGRKGYEITRYQGVKVTSRRKYHPPERSMLTLPTRLVATTTFAG